MGSKPAKDYGVKFVDINLKFGADMYFREGESVPDEIGLFKWIETMARRFWRVGFGYNENSHSYTCSFTYRGGLATDTPPCLVLHGSSPLSCLRKCYVVLELAGGASEGFSYASDVIAEVELKIEEAVKRLME